MLSLRLNPAAVCIEAQVFVTSQCRAFAYIGKRAETEVGTGLSQKMRFSAVLLCQVAVCLGANPNEAVKASDSTCLESEELLADAEDEALAASTLLLQANLHQSRVATPTGILEARVPPEMYSLLSHLEAANGSQFDTVLANIKEISEEGSDLWPVLQLLNSGKDKELSLAVARNSAKRGLCCRQSLIQCGQVFTR
eukprot:symbB.v1.2.030003.t1/scaffold3337.1/size61196/3